MHVISGGKTGDTEFSCMYNPNIPCDFFDEKNHLLGYIGIAGDSAPAIIWFDKDEQYVYGQRILI